VDTRRKFLTALLAAGAAMGAVARFALAQNPMPTTPRREPPAQEPGPESPNLPPPEKRLLNENEKEIKKKVEKLYELATELKAEVDKTDSSKVLSLDVLKKAEAIEKLARDIKNRSKG
jgi:hypothetical protein